MELDLGQVRAFVAAADERHVTRAARELNLSQQAVSKRLARLEQALGLLLVRGPTGVTPTERGQRFLPFARDLLAVADTAAAAAVDAVARPLRVDVWGHLHPAVGLVRGFARDHPDAALEISMRRHLPEAVEALEQRRIDVAFGYVPGLPGPLPKGLTAVPVTVTRLVALVGDSGPYALAGTLRPEDLRGCPLWFPGQGSSPEVTAYAREYARHVHADLRTDGVNLGLDALLERLTVDPDLIAVVADDWPVHDVPGLRIVPVHPAPLYPWWAVWHSTSPHPAAAPLIAAARAAGDRAHPGEDAWLPTGTR